MAKRIEILEGDRFGRWVVINELDSYRQPNGKLARKLLCKCDCGEELAISLGSLRNGKSKSCGCYMKEVNGIRIGNQSRIHGNTPTGYNEYKSLFFVWFNLKQRCYNSNNAKYAVYGAKGVIVCNEWLNNFANFRDWSIANGYYKQPKDISYKDKLSIDRIDSKGNYCPDNCRWITVSENSSRRHIKNR